MAQPVIPAFSQFRFGTVIIIAQIVIGIYTNYIDMLPDTGFKEMVKGSGINDCTLIDASYLLYKRNKQGRVGNIVNLCCNYQMREIVFI